MGRGETGRLEKEVGNRLHTISVRVSPSELEEWDEARQPTGRKERGRWVRSVVKEALSGSPALPGDIARVPEVNHAAYLELARIGNNLNQLTRWSHQEGRLHPGLDAAIEAVGNAALALRGLAPLDEVPPAEDEA